MTATMPDPAPTKIAAVCFTLEQAEAAIPYVDRVVHDYLWHVGGMVHAQKMMDEARRTAPGKEESEVYKQWQDTYLNYQSKAWQHAAELGRAGVAILDHKTGLCGFATLRTGDAPVYLWLPGNDKLIGWIRRGEGPDRIRGMEVPTEKARRR